MSDNIIPSIILHPGELAQFPLNANSHPPAQIEELVASRERFSQYRNVVGWRCPQDIETQTADGKPVTLKKGVMYVIAGNGFHQASVKRADEAIEVKDYSHLSLDEAILLAETDNAAPLGAQRLVAQLQANLERARGLYQDDERMRRMFDRLKEQAGVNGKGTAGRDAEPQIDKAAELREKWGVELGQVWELPSLVDGKPHRIVCGDCTDRATVERVMGGERFDLMITDPSYGVDYEGGRNPVSNVPREKLSGDSSPALYNSFLSVWKNYRAKKGVLYIWFADRGGKPVYNAIEDNGFEIRALIIWNKIDAHYGNFMAQYMQKHEPCLYCVRDGTNWYGPTNEVTVWDIKQPNINEFHPTQKPLECMTRPINNSSKEGDLACDPFLGSGTTLIAAHQLGRICYGCELNPGYVGVILERYHEATNGLTPTLVSG